MVKIIIKGGTIILTAPATLPAAAVVGAGVLAVGVAAYGIYRLSNLSKGRKMPSVYTRQRGY